MQHIAILEAEGPFLRFQVEGDYTAADIGDAVEGLIALLDKRFAPYDPDEPDFRTKSSDGAPGDLADAEPDGTDWGDPAWIEWDQMRGSQKRGPNLAGQNEDDEPNGDEHDGNFAEDEECASHARWGYGPGCIVADPDKAVDDEGVDPEEGY